MIIETTAKSILRKRKKIDSWFITHYGLNLYRGCRHNCVYCDGRAESYYVQGDFGNDIEVKTNAFELLKKELDPARKRKPMPKSFIMLGGGVCDAYQPVEKKYNLARQTLELCLQFKYPVHILTKSCLVERDLDLLKKINNQNNVIISFSFSSADEEISKIFEPGVSKPSERFELISKIKNTGIKCGMYLMPVIPFITDMPEVMENTLKKGKNAGIDFVIFGNMTLKTGRQKDYFMQVITEHYSQLLPEYDTLYQSESRWGAPAPEYVESVHELFNKIASHLEIPKRIPLKLVQDILNENDKIIVILEHLDYLLKLRHEKSPFGYAAYQLSKIKEPLRNMSPGDILNIQGVGRRTFHVIQEILETGKYSTLDKIL
jgi:DNA repair photolyase